MKRLSLALALALSTAACGEATDSPSDGGTTTDGGTTGIEPKLSVISEKIFKSKCIACHSASAPPSYGSLALTADKAYAQLVDQAVKGDKWPARYAKRVVAGDPENSALSASIEQRKDVPDALHMPVGLKLSDAEITAINTWIQDGAQNN